MNDLIGGAFDFEDNAYVIYNGNDGKNYKVCIYNGTAWYTVFKVNAYHEQDAFDVVMDFCVKNELTGLYFETLQEDDYEEEFVCCGNNGYYFYSLSRIEEV